MLGYTYSDIQAFGNSLTWAIDTAKNQGDEQNYKQLLMYLRTSATGISLNAIPRRWNTA